MPWRTMATRSMPRPKAKPRDLLRVVDHAAEARVHGLEHRGVHHARAHDLEPARLLADAAALARRRRRSRGRPRPTARCTGSTTARKRTGYCAPKSACRKASIVPFRSPRVMPGPTTSAFDLLEHRRVRDVVVAAVDLARADDPHVGRVRVRQHVADLRRSRCACAAAGPPGPSGRTCPACRARGGRAAC